VSNIITGWAEDLYIQREEEPEGFRWDDVHKDSGRVAFSIQPNHKQNFEQVGMARARRGYDPQYIFYEWKLQYEMDASNVTCQLIRNLLQNYDFAHEIESAIEAKTFRPGWCREPQTFALWINQTLADTAYLLQGCAVNSIEITIPSRSIIGIKISGGAFAMTAGDGTLIPSHYAVDTNDPRQSIVSNDARIYLTTGDFELALSNYLLPNVLSTSIRLERSFSIAGFARNRTNKRYVIESGVDCRVEMGMRQLPTDIAKIAAGRLEAALVYRLGLDSDLARFWEILIPNALLTFGALEPQNTTNDLQFKMTAYAKQNMESEGGVALRLLRDDGVFDGGEIGETDVFTTPGLDGGNAGDAMSDDDYSYCDFGEIA
jgi:hypothetical protein